MNLLLDLGNTRLKWAFAEGGPLREPGDMSWREARMSALLTRHWQQRPAPARVMAAAVSDSRHREQVAHLLDALGWPAPEWLQSPAQRGGLANGYARPQDLGIDRFLAMLAAWREGLAPCVLASCGTALTLDLLDADGRHRGGWIVPGIEAMLEGLRRAAPALPDAADGRCMELGVTTADAMQSGVWQATAGAVERFMASARKSLGNVPRVLVSGGDGPRLRALLGVHASPFEHAVLRGLAAWPETE